MKQFFYIVIHVYSSGIDFHEIQIYYEIILIMVAHSSVITGQNYIKLLQILYNSAVQKVFLFQNILKDLDLSHCVLWEGISIGSCFHCRLKIS